jgi:hypothetical protein
MHVRAVMLIHKSLIEGGSFHFEWTLCKKDPAAAWALL